MLNNLARGGLSLLLLIPVLLTSACSETGVRPLSDLPEGSENLPAAGEGPSGDSEDLAPPDDNLAPQIQITEPALYSVHSPEVPVLLRALVSDDEDPAEELTVDWELLVSGEPLASDLVPSSAGQVMAAVWLEAGGYALLATVTDRSGHTSFDSVSFVIEAVEDLPDTPPDGDGGDDDDLVCPPGGDGTSASCPAITCLEILQNGYSTGSGTYWLNPDGNGPVQYQCDMVTDEGGWTLIFDWDRANDGDGIVELGMELTGTFNNMGIFSEQSSNLRWCDDSDSADVMAYERMVEVPNRGETLTGIHYEGSNAMGESGAWVFAETSSGDENIHCSDNITSSAYYTGVELSYRPNYSCGLADLNWDWNETVQDDFGVEVDVFHFVSLHEDYGCGDRSDLYFMELWVR